MSGKSQNKAATTVKVAGQTGAAKDEVFSGFTEDNANQILNVLANDPGSAYLWSLDQNALNAPAGSQLPQNLASVVLASGATISANPDGTVSYSGGSALQSLRAGEVGVDSFIYVIRMANGALSTARAEVQITGVNDVAGFGGVATGNVEEDGTTLAGGVLTVSDVDRDEGFFASTGNLQGQYGVFSFDLDTGAWSYQLNNSADNVQALKTGETVQDQLEVFSVDGSSTFITVDIAGKDESAGPAGVDWKVNRQNLIKEGSGFNDDIDWDGIFGSLVVNGFGPNDRLGYVNSMEFAESYQEFLDGDDVLDTMVVLKFNQGQQTKFVEIELLGVSSFNNATQLFQYGDADPR